MKRWLVALLVLLAVIVFVSPGIVGRLAERSVEDSISRSHEAHGDVHVSQERFERGWFTAAGRHRVDLNAGVLHDLLAALAGAAPEASPPALIVDTRVDHGLVPFTSLGRESGSLLPALASTVSTIALDLGGGDPVPLPAKLYTTVGVSGATSSRLVLEAGALEEREGVLAWGDGDVAFATDPLGRSMTWEGAVAGARMRSGAGSAEATELRYEGKAAKTPYGFSVGRAALRLREAQLANGRTGVEVGALEADAESDLSDERYSAAATLLAEGLIPGELDPLDLALAARLAGLEARLLGRLLFTLAELGEEAAPGAPVRDPWPLIASELRLLASAGGRLDVDRLDLALPEGTVAAKLALEIPVRDAGEQPLQWASLLLALTGRAQLEMPVAVAERMVASYPDAGFLIASGALRRKGELYLMDARYAQGVLTVNGAPVPIPLPGR